MKLISIEQAHYDRLHICGKFEPKDADALYDETIINNYYCTHQTMTDGHPGRMCFEYLFNAIDKYEDPNEIEVILFRNGDVDIVLKWEKYYDIPMDLIYACYYNVVHTKLKMFPYSQYGLLRAVSN